MAIRQIADKDKRTPGNFITIIINSTSYFIISFLFLYLVAQFSTAIAAMQFDYTSIVYYFKLVYTIDTYDWNSDAVKLLFSLGPTISIMIGIMFLLIYINLYSNTGRFKMFFLWTFMHGVIWFFGAILAGTILDKGFGFVVMYAYFLDTGKLILSLMALTVILLVATFSTKWFLFSANSYFNQLTEHSRTFFTFSQIVIPVVLGTTILIGIKLPMITYYELFILLCNLFFILPILLKYNSYPTFFFDEIPIHIKLDFKAMVIAAIFLAAFRVALEKGIPFG